MQYTFLFYAINLIHLCSNAYDLWQTKFLNTIHLNLLIILFVVIPTARARRKTIYYTEYYFLVVVKARTNYEPLTWIVRYSWKIISFNFVEEYSYHHAFFIILRYLWLNITFTIFRWFFVHYMKTAV